jgi:hypothetical protein
LVRQLFCRFGDVWLIEIKFLNKTINSTLGRKYSSVFQLLDKSLVGKLVMMVQQDGGTHFKMSSKDDHYLVS